MTRNKWNVIVDILAYVAMVGLAATGLALAYRLPPGFHKQGLLGMGRHGWGDVHFYIAIALMALAVLHLALHWGWMVRSIGKAALLGLCLVTAAAVAAPWCLPLTEISGGGCGGCGESDGGKQKGQQAKACSSCSEKDGCSDKDGQGTEGKGQGNALGLNGRSTLAQAAQAAGVPVARLLTELGLPADTAPSDELRDHGFRQEKMGDARAIIERLRQSTKAATPQEGAK